MNPDQKLLADFEQRIEREYREARAAFELLSRYFNAKPFNSPVNSNGEDDKRHGIQKGSQRERIGKVIKEFKTVAEIAAKTGMAESAVRGCLYAKDFGKKVDKRKIGGKVRFRMKKT